MEPHTRPPSAANAELPQVPATIARWIKTECGRAKYLSLASRSGVASRIRLAWFVLIAALRDWRLPG
jgi:hypothetical protein